MKTYRVQCNGTLHRVVIGDRGVRFLDHINGEVWSTARCQATLNAISGQPHDLDGCLRLAELVVHRLYIAARYPDRSQQLLSALYGKATARKLKHAKGLAR